MIFLILSLFLCAIISAQAEDSLSGYCDANSQSCSEDFPNQKYILYDVNPPEGFNLRRDVYMRFAILLHEARSSENKKHWNLVLPPWYRLYHWKDYSSSPIPWSRFFDMESLRTFAPVLELHELFSSLKTKKFVIDRLYVLKNFKDAFEDGEFRDKWEITDCNYKGNFWDYHNITVKETICVKFQGVISKLWELIALHPADNIVMFDHGEIPLHSHYGDKKFWDCRRSMKFNEELVQTAKKYISKQLKCDKPKCSNYLSIHWRRQDFARSRKRDVPSTNGTVKQINKAIQTYNPHIMDIFIASDAQNKELVELENELMKIGYKIHFFKPSQNELNEFKDGGIAIIDQIICSHAAYFIGTHESTFSFRIQEEREILGFDSSTTFNRFCPDSGACEKPSKWTIIH